MEPNLTDCIIYRCVVGSRAYGLDVDGSDTDRRGIYLPPADLHWSLDGVPEQLEYTDTQECYWEIGKFIRLALKANPNILECLYTPLVETAAPVAQRLLEQRDLFLSRQVYRTYNQYVLSQFRRMENHRLRTGAVRWKHAMHLIRLLLTGITALREGHIPVRVEDHRERLLAVRRGELTWEAVNAWRAQLHDTFDAAYRDTRLPEQPDTERANRLLVEARRSAL